MGFSGIQGTESWFACVKEIYEIQAVLCLLLLSLLWIENSRVDYNRERKDQRNREDRLAIARSTRQVSGNEAIDESSIRSDENKSD